MLGKLNELGKIYRHLRACRTCAGGRERPRELGGGDQRAWGGGDLRRRTRQAGGAGRPA